MPGKKLNITVHIEYLTELPVQQRVIWDRYYQKLISEVKAEIKEIASKPVSRAASYFPE